MNKSQPEFFVRLNAQSRRNASTRKTDCIWDRLPSTSDLGEVRAVPVIAGEPGPILGFRSIEDLSETLFHRRVFARGWRAGALGRRNENHRVDAELILSADSRTVSWH